MSPPGEDIECSIFDPPAQNAKKKVTSSAALVIGSQVVRTGSQVLSIIALSRFLSPSDFGVVAMTAPIVAFANMIQDLGLTQATVQARTLTHRHATTLFWINFSVGLMIAALLCSISGLVAAYYHDDRARALLLASAPIVIISATFTQHSALLARRMDFASLSAIDTASAIIGLLASVGSAILLRNFWALWIGTITTAVATGVFAQLRSGWRPSLPQKDREFRRLFKFGAGVTGFSLSNFFARNLDNILIGRQFGSLQLGLYDRAYKLLLLPIQSINNPIQRVMTPALSRMVDDPERYRRAYLRAVGLMGLITVPGIVAMAVGADRLIPLALGPQWVDAIPIYRCLAVAGFAQMITNPTGWLFISQARTSDFARWGIFSAASCAIAFVIGLNWGVIGLAAGYAISEIFVRTPALCVYAGRDGPVSSQDLARMSLSFLFYTILAGAITWPLANSLNCSNFTALIIITFSSYASFICAMSITESGRESIWEMYSLVKSAIRSAVRTDGVEH